MSRQSKWTAEQDEILWEFGNEGAERCAEIIAERFGVRRKPDAVQRHASRIGVSLVTYEICCRCGAKARKLDEEGFCPTCHQRGLAEKQKAFNSVLLKEIRMSESGEEFTRAKRSYEKARQENSRLCRKHGLPGQRERKYGEFAKCPSKVSTACSSA